MIRAVVVLPESIMRYAGLTSEVGLKALPPEIKIRAIGQKAQSSAHADQKPIFVQRMTVVRKALLSDRTSIRRMWRRLALHEAAIEERLTLASDFVERWDADFEPWLRSRVHAFYVASSDADDKDDTDKGDTDTACGFVHVRLYDDAPIFDTPRQALVEALWVDPEARRCGLARSLVEAAAGWAAEQGAHRLRYGVLAVDAVAVAFWRTVGGSDVVAYGTIDLVAAEPVNRPSC